AVEVARRAGRPIVLAGKVDAHDLEHFVEAIEPHVDGDRVRVVGEVAGETKRALLAGADALLFPIDWDEPFGLVMIESLASGTPVVAFRRGSAPEIVEHGATGFVVDDTEAMVGALRHLSIISRRHCREVAEARFTIARMTDDYERHYARVAATGARTGDSGAGGDGRDQPEGTPIVR
ncbi:MAG: glycosyltransferase, partial [Chloroflexota bacterium]